MRVENSCSQFLPGAVQQWFAAVRSTDTSSPRSFPRRTAAPGYLGEKMLSRALPIGTHGNLWLFCKLPPYYALRLLRTQAKYEVALISAASASIRLPVYAAEGRLNLLTDRQQTKQVLRHLLT